MAVVPGENLAIVSLDTVHSAGSTKTPDMSRDTANEMLASFKLVQSGKHWEWKAAAETTLLTVPISRLDIVSEAEESDAVAKSRARGDYSALGEFLYGLENLRKRRGAAADDAEGDDEHGEEVDVNEP